MIGPLQLEVQKAALLSGVDGWSPQRLAHRPAGGCWSASQVFDHLVTTEERILDAAQRGFRQPHRIGVSDRVRTIFLRKVFESDRRVKVPASATQVLPAPSPSMEDVCARWQAVRHELAVFHGQFSPAQLRRGIFKHPVGGWMALPDVVEFFYVHMLHHRFQLDRLSAESQNL